MAQQYFMLKLNIDCDRYSNTIRSPKGRELMVRAIATIYVESLDCYSLMAHGLNQG